MNQNQFKVFIAFCVLGVSFFAYLLFKINQDRLITDKYLANNKSYIINYDSIRKEEYKDSILLCDSFFKVYEDSISYWKQKGNNSTNIIFLQGEVRCIFQKSRYEIRKIFFK